MSSMKQYYPIGVQSFKTLRENGYVYIDKTHYIKQLVARPRYIFLSRPRRFGKSLLLSAMEEYFKGNRHLFKGLAIDTDDIDWTPRPVFTFSFNNVDPKSEDDLVKVIENSLSFYEQKYDILPEIDSITARLENLIKGAYERHHREVAVLVDEYDSPLLSTLKSPSLNNAYRDTLRAVFSALKSLNDYIYFEFVAGISRFSHTSLFSGANNLKDITLLDEYASICGITEEEFRSYLTPGVVKFAEKKLISIEDAFATFKRNYDGYHFSPESPDIYNPFSLLSALDDSLIKDYWFSSGTPSYLMEVMKNDNFYLPKLECLETVASELGAKESYVTNPIALLYESGYLTIKHYDEESGIFTLGLPNEEVAVSFTKALMPIYSGYSDTEYNDLFVGMRKAIINGKAQDFMKLLQTFLSGNPYSNTELGKRETYFKNNLFLIFKALGFRPHVEEQTCNSRMDNMLETRRFIYIFELKVDKTAEEALMQINEKGYANPWRLSGKEIIKIGANYSSHTNNIDDWSIETIITETL